ncbi:MAG: hypothetical protein R3E11_09470 [Sphingobium sp.]
MLSLTRSRKSHVSAEIVRQINAYRDHLNTLFGTDEAPAIPPGPDGKPWQITTRQFRRTIAWHIANRPFGTVAGMIQVQACLRCRLRGYAGSSASGFRAEVETQRGLRPSSTTCSIISTGGEVGHLLSDQRGGASAASLMRRPRRSAHCRR